MKEHTMDRVSTMKAIDVALREVLQRELPPLDERTRLFDELHLDSTSVLELLMALEDAVDMTVNPEDLRAEDFTTIGSLADYVLANTDELAVG
jgi:acyl carrier protein